MQTGTRLSAHRPRTAAIRAPDHLGDGVMALPAITAIAAAYPTVVHAPRWGAELYAGLRVVPAEAPPDAEVGVLFKPSVGAAWRWRHLRERVGVGRIGLLTTSVSGLGHRAEGYARVAAALGVDVRGTPVFSPRGVAPPLPDRFVGLNPWSPSPTVRWPHFRALADALAEPVVFFAGPGEGDAVRAIAGPHPVVEGLTLPDFAAALDRCRVFVSGDSGAAHFAAACGARVVVVYGSTDPALTGPAGATPVLGPRPWCAPCYRKACPFHLRCLAPLAIDAVRGAL